MQGGEKYKLSKNKEEQYLRMLKLQQSENKQQYKKLADALLKQKQYTKVSEALLMDKQLNQKGKKRKSEDEQTGKISYKWFSERKR